MKYTEMREMLIELYGKVFVNTFTYYVETDQHRIGQAFFNALVYFRPEQAETLRGSLADPFQYDDVESVLKALDFLTKP